MIENLLSDIKFTERESALLKHNNKEEKEILPFVTQYQPSVSTLKEVLMKKWNLIQNQPLLRQIFKEPPIISYKEGKSLKDMLVRAKTSKVNTRFYAGIDVRPFTPCIFSCYVYRCSCRRDQKKIEVIPAWIHKLPRLQQWENCKIWKIPYLAGGQHLENSNSNSKLESSNSCPKDLENSRLRQDLESSNSCRQDLENSRSCNSYELTHHP